MTNFVLLYTGGTMPKSEEEKADMMAAWGAWYEKIGAAVGNWFCGDLSKAVSICATLV